MDIVIANNDTEYGIDVYKISLEQFADKAYHPFIATQKWDNITVEISDETPRGIIRQLLPLGRIKVVIKDVKTLSGTQARLLGEVFPDESARIMKLFMSNKDELCKLVEELIRK